MSSTSTTTKTMNRHNAPAFSNPFGAGYSVDQKTYPSIATPFNAAIPRADGSETGGSQRDPNSPGPETPGSIKSRSSSFFQWGFGSDKGTPGSERKHSIFSRKGSFLNPNSGRGDTSPAYSVEGDRPSPIRRPSYVPKYAAKSHLASMTGRSTSAGSDELNQQLRRGSRMMSIVPGEMGAPSRLIHTLPEAVEGN